MSAMELVVSSIKQKLYHLPSKKNVQFGSLVGLNKQFWLRSCLRSSVKVGGEAVHRLSTMIVSTKNYPSYLQDTAPLKNANTSHQLELLMKVFHNFQTHFVTCAPLTCLLCETIVLHLHCFPGMGQGLNCKVRNVSSFIFQSRY